VKQSKIKYPKLWIYPEVLSYNTKPNHTATKHPFVLTYSPQLHSIKHIAKDLQPLLDFDPYLHNIFPSTPLISYRQPPNLRRILTSSQSPITNPTNGTFPCNSPKCLLCQHINTTHTITGPNGFTHPIKGYFNCNTSNIIYAITCNLCPGTIYIGETGNTLRQRMNGHRSDIKARKNKPVANHFNQSNHDICNLKITVLSKLNRRSRQQREIEEQKYIFKFNSIHQGLNKDFSFMSHYV